MSTGKLNKIAVIGFLVILALILSNYQAYFYSDTMLNERASKESERVLLDKHCDKISFIGDKNDPAGGVRVFTWRCLSKVSDSIDLSVLIEGDGYPRRYSERLVCTPELVRQGFSCESSTDSAVRSVGK